MRHAIFAPTGSALCAVLFLAGPALAQTLPAGATRTVTLPLSEYDRLVERAAHPPTPPTPPPVAAVVARADLKVVASASEVRATITFQGELLREGVIKVPLLAGGTLLDAQQAGRPVAVVNEGGLTSAALAGPGPFTVVVSWGGDVTTEPGRAVATLPLTRAGTVRALVEVPGDNTDVRSDGALVGSRTSAAGRTSVDITLEPGMPCRLSWSSRDHAAPAVRELRFASDVKTLVTVGETDLRLASLFDVTVQQGQPERLEVQLPEGFEVASVSGASIETTARAGAGSRLSLDVREPSARRHQFLVTLERTFAAGMQRASLDLPGVVGTQRESGEVAWEGDGAVELTAAEKGALRRLDVSEVGASLASLARAPLLTAFRYQRRSEERVAVEFDVRRFADAPVLAGMAEHAAVTTLLTSEGRALTEVTLTLRNRGQLFLKVGVPKGATLLSAEVSGQAVKPVEGTDGSRVPLVRPGFQPGGGAYQVSFVYLSSGTALGKSGDGQLVLPRIDMPIGRLDWELFLPDRYKVKRFDGDLVPIDRFLGLGRPGGATIAMKGVAPRVSSVPRIASLRPDQVAGQVVDNSGAVLPGVTVTVTQGNNKQSAVTDAQGVFLVSGVASGALEITTLLPGFTTTVYTLPSAGTGPVRLTMEVGRLAETVEVHAETPVIGEQPVYRAPPPPARPKSEPQIVAQAPSQNVVNLQRRVAGVLPVRIDIPRAGQSFMFVRPLVLEEETTLRFQYKTK